MYRLLPAILGVLALVSVDADLCAQIVRGQVVDSVSHRPLAAASVTLLDSNGHAARHTVTDADGLFLIVAPRSGSFQLRVVRNGYRTSTFPPFGLRVGQVQGFMLLVAAAPLTDDEIIAHVCAGDLPDTTFIIVGIVTYQQSGRPAPDAQVSFSWPAVPGALARLLGGNDVEHVMDVAPDGVYAICGVPPGSRVRLYAALEELVSRFVQLVFLRGGVVSGDTLQPTASQVWRQDLMLLPQAHQTAAIVGVVTDTAGIGIDAAEVRLLGVNRLTTTDSTGHFRFDQLPDGTAELEIRRIGFLPLRRDIALRLDHTVELSPPRLILEHLPVRLSDITVEAQNPRRRRLLVEFEERRRRGQGHYLAREEFEKMVNAQATSDVLRQVGGLRVRGSGMTLQIVSTRYGCPPSVYMDHLYLGTTATLNLDVVVPLAALEAVEVHTVATTPLQYMRGGAPCGVILLWTR